MRNFDKFSAALINFHKDSVIKDSKRASDLYHFIERVRIRGRIISVPSSVQAWLTLKRFTPLNGWKLRGNEAF